MSFSSSFFFSASSSVTAQCGPAPERGRPVPQLPAERCGQLHSPDAGACVCLARLAYRCSTLSRLSPSATAVPRAHSAMVTPRHRCVTARRKGRRRAPRGLLVDPRGVFRQPARRLRPHDPPRPFEVSIYRPAIVRRAPRRTRQLNELFERIGSGLSSRRSLLSRRQLRPGHERFGDQSHNAIDDVPAPKSYHPLLRTARCVLNHRRRLPGETQHHALGVRSSTR